MRQHRGAARDRPDAAIGVIAQPRERGRQRAVSRRGVPRGAAPRPAAKARSARSGRAEGPRARAASPAMKPRRRIRPAVQARTISGAKQSGTGDRRQPHSRGSRRQRTRAPEGSSPPPPRPRPGRRVGPGARFPAAIAAEARPPATAPACRNMTSGAIKLETASSPRQARKTVRAAGACARLPPFHQRAELGDKQHAATRASGRAPEAGHRPRPRGRQAAARSAPRGSSGCPWPDAAG
jgi:hypothetical protein